MKRAGVREPRRHLRHRRHAGELDAEHSVAVGDSVWDLAASGRRGLDCIGLLTGGTGQCELEAAGAAQVLATPAVTGN